MRERITSPRFIGCQYMVALHRPAVALQPKRLNMPHGPFIFVTPQRTLFHVATEERFLLFETTRRIECSWDSTHFFASMALIG